MVYSTKDGGKFIVRQPDENDAADLIAYSKMPFASTDQLLNTLAEYTITLKEEERWIQQMNENPGSLLLIANMEETIVGMIFFMSGNKSKTRHAGEFGINVHPEFQGKGIGRVLLQCLIDWATRHP